MKGIFTELCPQCKTLVRIEEVGEKYPAKTYDHFYCPVCSIALWQKNTMFFFEEYVESLDTTL